MRGACHASLEVSSPFLPSSSQPSTYCAQACYMLGKLCATQCLVYPINGAKVNTLQNTSLVLKSYFCIGIYRAPLIGYLAKKLLSGALKLERNWRNKGEKTFFPAPFRLPFRHSPAFPTSGVYIRLRLPRTRQFLANRAPVNIPYPVLLALDIHLLSLTQVRSVPPTSCS